jgi:hypothetical protein
VKRVLIRIIFPACLIASTGAAIANNTTDYFLQNDIADTWSEGLADSNQKHIDLLLEEGYSPAPIIMSAVAHGQTVTDTVFMMARSQPANAERFADTAESLLPNLPGWACSDANAMEHRYDSPLDPGDLGDSKSLAQVADLYFDKKKRIVNAPSWQNGLGHANIDLDELMNYKQAELEQAADKNSKTVESWWYLDSGKASSNLVTVGLYPEQRRVVIHNRLRDLQALQQSGVTQVPVLLMYNENHHIPMSDIEGVAGELYGGSEMKGNDIAYIDYNDGEITASEVINRFEKDGKRIAPARNWRSGDHHLMVRTAELEELFDIPKKQDIDPVVWQKAVNRLNQQSQNPLQLSLLADSGVKRFISNPVLVAVAKEASMKRLPVTFVYQGTERRASGMQSSCLADIKTAANAGSMPPDLFNNPTGKPPGASANGPPIILPAISPISPS